MEKQKKTYEEIHQELMFDQFWNLCLILEEIVDEPHKELIKKYKNVGVHGVTGVIIAEIRRRKYEGNKLRDKIASYECELSRLRQVEMFN